MARRTTEGTRAKVSTPAFTNTSDQEEIKIWLIFTTADLPSTGVLSGGLSILEERDCL